jgi:hypothetical protein
MDDAAVNMPCRMSKGRSARPGPWAGRESKAWYVPCGVTAVVEARPSVFNST